MINPNSDVNTFSFLTFCMKLPIDVKALYFKTQFEHLDKEYQNEVFSLGPEDLLVSELTTIYKPDNLIRKMQLHILTTNIEWGKIKDRKDRFFPLRFEETVLNSEEITGKLVVEYRPDLQPFLRNVQ